MKNRRWGGCCLDLHARPPTARMPEVKKKALWKYWVTAATNSKPLPPSQHGRTEMKGGPLGFPLCCETEFILCTARKMVLRIGAVCQRTIGRVFKNLSKRAALLVSHFLQLPNGFRRIIADAAAAAYLC